MRSTYNKVVEILEKAQNESLSIPTAAASLNYGVDVVRKYINNQSHNDINKGEITEEEGEYIKNLYMLLKNNSSVSTPQTTNVQHKSLDIDENFDDRSKCWEERDDEGKIKVYKFKILVRDEDTFIGDITREQMETIYQNYPYVTRNNVSSYFPSYTFLQFKRIIRVFNITKDHLFPKHWLEEKTPEVLSELALKAKAHAGYKKIIENKPIFIEKELRETQKRLLELEEKRDWVKETILDLAKNSNLKKLSFTPKKINKEKALNIFLSDMHIGACNKDAILNGDYNKEVFYNRLNQILQEVSEQKEIYKHFDTIHIMQLGDAVDGLYSRTVRAISGHSSHKLPQNLDNKEQFQTYVESMLYFIQEIYKMNFCNKIHFVSVGESNHGGDFEYTANLSLKYITEVKYDSDIFQFTLFDQAINHFEYGSSTYIITHGKDNDLMVKGLPLHVNDKADNFISDYIRVNKIKNDKIYLVKGDLHQYAQSVGKNITRYISVGSIYGGSSWINVNFGYTPPSTLIQIADKNTGKLVDVCLDLE